MPDLQGSRRLKHEQDRRRRERGEIVDQHHHLAVVTVDEHARKQDSQQIRAKEKELQEAHSCPAPGQTKDPDREGNSGDTGGNPRDQLAQPDDEKSLHPMRPGK